MATVHASIAAVLLAIAAPSAPVAAAAEPEDAAEPAFKAGGKCAGGELVEVWVAFPRGLPPGMLLTLPRPAGGWCTARPQPAKKET